MLELFNRCYRGSVLFKETHEMSMCHAAFFVYRLAVLAIKFRWWGFYVIRIARHRNECMIY